MVGSYSTSFLQATDGSVENVQPTASHFQVALSMFSPVKMTNIVSGRSYLPSLIGFDSASGSVSLVRFVLLDYSNGGLLLMWKPIRTRERFC